MMAALAGDAPLMPDDELESSRRCRGRTGPSARLSRGRFLLNPSGDLTRTQNSLAPVFEAFSRDHDWAAVAEPGAAPPEGAVRSALEDASCEIFVYCGHNAGETFLSARQ